MINHRVAQGRLIAIHRRVYLIAGATLTLPARELAAVLACRPAAAFVSRRSAAYRLNLLPYPPNHRVIDVITTARGTTSRRGIHVHHVAVLDPGDTIIAGDLPITSVRRTLLDLAWVTAGRELERALAAAQHGHQLEPAAMLTYLDQHRHRKGVGRLRRLLLGGRPPAFTRSESEEILLAALRAAGVSEQLTNAWVGRYEVDFLWPHERLIVESDSWRWHGDKAAVERDKRRDAYLAALGYRVIRVTWKRLVTELDAVVNQIVTALHTSSAPPKQG